MRLSSMMVTTMIQSQQTMCAFLWKLAMEAGEQRKRRRRRRSPLANRQLVRMRAGMHVRLALKRIWKKSNGPHVCSIELQL